MVSWFCFWGVSSLPHPDPSKVLHTWSGQCHPMTLFEGLCHLPAWPLVLFLGSFWGSMSHHPSWILSWHGPTFSELQRPVSCWHARNALSFTQERCLENVCERFRVISPARSVMLEHLELQRIHFITGDYGLRWSAWGEVGWQFPFVSSYARNFSHKFTCYPPLT